MRMPVNSGVSENVESFSNFQHGREICLNQKSSHKRGSAEKIPGYNSVAFVFGLLFVYRCKK